MPNLNDALNETGTATVETEDGIVIAQTVENEEKSEKSAKEKTPTKEKDLTVRPPMEQLTIDFENSLKEKEISGHKITKLGYKCGKIIYGFKRSGEKDFRCIAFKARKKSKSVNGKSRCIFYFGIDREKANELKKAHPELNLSKFGKCSVQSQTPVELILDRVTYTEKFNKNLDKVTALMDTLVSATIDSKTEQLTHLEEIKARKAAKTTKTEQTEE